VLLALDLFVFHRKAREMPFKAALWLSVFWTAISLAFGGFVWLLAGTAHLSAFSWLVFGIAASLGATRGGKPW
jgi:hypothetical protein